LRLLADKAVELDLVAAGFAYSSRVDLKKNQLKPHLKKTWCIAIMDALFIARMERILSLYNQEFDARFPVLCFDERRVF
jgi:hypothetical protein